MEGWVGERLTYPSKAPFFHGGGFQQRTHDAESVGVHVGVPLVWMGGWVGGLGGKGRWVGLEWWVGGLGGWETYCWVKVRAVARKRW